MSQERGSSQDPSEKPEPDEDAPPDPGPGGPADWVEHDDDDLPPATPDQPLSAQVEEEHVPDEIEQPEESGEDEDKGEQGDEPSG